MAGTCCKCSRIGYQGINGYWYCSDHLLVEKPQERVVSCGNCHTQSVTIRKTIPCPVCGKTMHATGTRTANYPTWE